MTTVVDIDENERFILLVDILDSFSNGDALTLLLALCVKVVDGLN